MFSKLIRDLIIANKRRAELSFWKKTLEQYIAWYEGRLPILYGETRPVARAKIKGATLLDSAILTWEKTHQQPKYLDDLGLSKKVFSGKTILDLGSGPHPSARVFTGAKVYCLDPLLPSYAALGFPLHYYDNVKYIVAKAEAIPLPRHSVDAVISVNALDHVDNFAEVVAEIRRVLKPRGKLCLHLHYHRATTEEPIELTDTLISQAFSWCPNFHKKNESYNKRGYTLLPGEGKFAVWSNL